MTEPFRWTVAEEAAQLSLFGRQEADERRGAVGQFDGLEFLHVRAKRVINEIPGRSPAPYRFSINAYRGCSHACAYCFARPTHSYLNLDIGNDFDTKIVVKVNAVERVRSELASPTWSGAGIAMGTNTDPYQRAEGKYQLTRGIIGALADARNPFSILTKSTLVLRDLDELTRADGVTKVEVNFSIPTIDTEVWRRTEPGAPHPQQRVRAVRRLRRAGIRCGVLVAPVLPGISDGDDQLRAVIEACAEAGASWVAPSLLHVKPGLRDHWTQWIIDNYPELTKSYENAYGHRSYATSDERTALSSKGHRILADVKRTADNKSANDRHCRS